MKNVDWKKLHALALLGAVTGAGLISAGAARAAPPVWSCEDRIPGRDTHDGLRCSQGAFPLVQSGAARRDVGPEPNPPYSP